MRWLDAAFELKRFADELALVVCAVRSKQVFQQQTGVGKFQDEVAQSGFLLICIEFERKILEFKS